MMCVCGRTGSPARQWMCMNARLIPMTRPLRPLCDMRLRFTLISMALVIQVQAVEWERTAPLPEPASGFVAGAVKGKILVAGGTNWPGGVKHWMDSVWLFAPATNQWQAGP